MEPRFELGEQQVVVAVDNPVDNFDTFVAAVDPVPPVAQEVEHTVGYTVVVAVVVPVVERRIVPVVAHIVAHTVVVVGNSFESA